MKKRNSFAILTIAGAAVLSLASCEKAQPEPKPDPGHQHTYSELHAKVEPTCLSEGVEAYYSCTGCDLLFNENKEVISQPEAIPALPHTPHHHDATDPSCTEPGTGEYWTCDNAGDDKLYGDKDCKEVIQSIPVVDPKGHKLSHMDGNPASCKEVGWKEYYKCDDCDALFEDAEGKTSIADLEAWKKGAGKLDLAPHSAQFVAGQASTCKEHGWRDYYHCGGCDGYFEDQAATKPIEDLEVWKAGAGKLELAAHTPVKQDGKAPTCTSDGWKDYYQCSECKGYFEDEAGETPIADLAAWKIGDGKIPAKGHDKDLTKTEKVEPTCYQTGVKEYYKCESCGKYFEDADAKTEISDLAAWKAGAGLIRATGDHDFDYSKTEVTWVGDMATAVAPCSTEGCVETISEEKQGSYVKDSDATCTSPELGHYEVTFDNTNFGSAQTDEGSVPHGDPHAHTYGDLIPQVDPLRENTGIKAHYQCSECKGYFDADKNPTTESNLVIPAPAHHFDAGEDLTIKFDSPIATTETVYVDFKFINAEEDSHINISLLGNMEDGYDWKNYLGYYKLFSDHVGDDVGTGVLFETITDDGYTRVKIDMNAVTKVAGTKPEAVNALYVRGAWSNVEGYIEINSTVEAHELGDFVEAKDPVRDVDGCLEHYKCKNCDAWLDEFGNVISKDEYTLKNPISTVGAKGTKAIEWHFEEPKGTKNPFGLSPIKAEGKVDLCDIQFSDVPAGGHSEFGVKLYDQWSTYYFLWFYSDGRVEVDGAASERGVKDAQNVGVTYSTLDDGWTRVTIDFDFLNTQSQFLSDEGGKGSFEYINFIEDKNASGNPTYGKVEWFPTCYHKADNRGTLLAGGKQASFKNCGVLGLEDTVSIDIKFVTATKVRIVFYTDDWKDIKKGQTDTTFDIKINADGSIIDQRKGANVFKVYNKDGSDTGYLRLFVNFKDFLAGNYYKKDGIFYEATSVNMFCSESYSDGSHYIDVKPNADVVVDPFLTFAGGSANKGLNFKSANYVNIKDGDGNFLTDKALSLDVRAEGSGKVYMCLMDDNWNNLGKLVMTFEDGELTDCVMQGAGCGGKKVDGTDTGNVWPKRNANADGSWNLNIPIGKLNGNGWASTDGMVGFFYDGDGILADGVTSFGVNTLSFCLADIITK